MVNALGFPNPGVEVFIKNLQSQKVQVPVIGSVSGRKLENIAKCYDKLQPHVAGIANLSSPNTSKSRISENWNPSKNLPNPCVH